MTNIPTKVEDQFAGFGQRRVNLDVQSSSYRFKPKRANTNGVWIYFVIDASGSMAGRESDTIGGFNAYLADQEKKEGKAWISALKFESNNIVRIRDKVELPACRKLSTDEYRVGGGTNLLDATGFALREINNWMETVDREHRPTPVIVIITDGEENQSRYWSQNDLRVQVEECQGKNWQMVYLGANANAWQTQQAAASLGLHHSKAFNYTTHDMATAYNAVGAATTIYRGLASQGLMAKADEDTFESFRKNEVK